MFTNFISTDGTTIPKMHQDFSLSFLRSALEGTGLCLIQSVSFCVLKCVYMLKQTLGCLNIYF